MKFIKLNSVIVIKQNEKFHKKKFQMKCSNVAHTAHWVPTAQGQVPPYNFYAKTTYKSVVLFGCATYISNNFFQLSLIHWLAYTHTQQQQHGGPSMAQDDAVKYSNWVLKIFICAHAARTTVCEPLVYTERVGQWENTENQMKLSETKTQRKWKIMSTPFDQNV